MPILGALAVGAGIGAVAERYGLPVPNINMVRGQFVNNAQNIDAQAFELAKREIIYHEGNRTTVYRDSLGIPTVGIGHKVLPQDNLKVGDSISTARVNQFFAADIAKAFDAAKSQARELNKYNPQMIASLTSVNFQLGTGWRSKFPNTWSLIKSGNTQAAINNLVKSAWYRQTPNRVTSFVNTLRTQYA
jgi:GH24 family phage-related lysozyme (muramidase)